MSSPFREMDLIVKTMDDAINKLGMIKMTKPIIEVESINPHYYVKKDNEVVAIFNDILNPNALTDAYSLKDKLEKDDE